MSLFTPLLWSFLPSQITHIALPYLSSSLPSIFPPAPKGTARYQKNYKLAFTGVICLYLAYTFVKDDGAGPGENWYALLGVPRDVDDDGLKRAYRSLSRLYHPDRAGAGIRSEELFISIRRAYETLSDPVKRYAYNRFGPGSVNWKAASVREYTILGLQHSVGFYLISGGLMILLSLLGRAREGAYWRQALFVFLLVSELALITSPTTACLSIPIPIPFPLVINIPPLITDGQLKLFPSSPQFIQIYTLHKIFTTLSIAITQLAGIWYPPSPENAVSAKDAEGMSRVMHALKSLEMEAITGFQNEVALLMSTGDARNIEALVQHHMEDILYERTIASHPATKEAYHSALFTNRHRQTHPHERRQHPILQPLSAAASSIALGSSPKPGLGIADIDLELAQSIPLPPSPPPSPVMRSSGRI
ncbi:hypothetical protein IAU59_004572 [Kwoniella sp. CBS 9459]